MSKPEAVGNLEGAIRDPAVSPRLVRSIMEARHQDTPFTQAGPAGRRRSRLEVVFDILEVVGPRGGFGPTTIMFKANISWKVLRESTAYLIEQGFIVSRLEGNRERISLTPIGVRLLEMLRAIRALLLSGREVPQTDSRPVSGWFLLNLQAEVPRDSGQVG